MATQLVDTHDESLPETLAVVEAKEDITEPPAELDVVAEAEAHHFEDPETEPTTWDLLAIACRLLYEVLEPTFLVRVALDLESDLVMAEPLAVGTRVHALWMCEVNEESIGVHVALENQSQPLGWITFLVGSTSMQPVDRQMHEVISARPVLARADAMLSSSEVGRLGIGQLVLVLQDLGQEDGSRRACVALEGSSAPLGWITYCTRDGTFNLRRVANPKDTEDAFTDGATASKTAQKVITPVISTLTKARSTRLMKKRGPDSPEEGRRDATAALSALMPAKEVRSVLEAQSNKLKREEEAAFHMPLHVRLGEALAARQTKVRELVREWAKRGVEPISKMEFRSNVRKVVGKATSTKEVDGLFQQLDADQGGTLDVDELTTALSELQAGAAAAAVERENSKVGIDLERQKVESVREVLGKTEDFEAAMAALEAETSDKRLAAEIGRTLLARKIRLRELVSKWQDSERDDGKIGRGSFRQHILKLDVGMEPADEDIDQLFDSLDRDSDGSLDHDELEEALKMLQDAAATRAAKIDRLKNEAHSLHKIVKASQNELKKLMHEEQLLLRATLKAEMEAEEARVRFEQDARAKKAEEAEAAKRKKAKEKAAYDAKIAAKRGLRDSHES